MEQLTQKRFEHLKKLAANDKFILLGVLIGYDIPRADGSKLKLVFADGKCELNKITEADKIAEVEAWIEKCKTEGKQLPFAVFDELASLTVAETVNVKFSDGNVYQFTPEQIEQAVSDAKTVSDKDAELAELRKAVADFKESKGTAKTPPVVGTEGTAPKAKVTKAPKAK